MPKLDHDQRRSQICLIHFRKIKKNGKLLKSNKELHKLVVKFYPELSSVDLEDPRYPSAICSTCYVLLYAHERGDTKKLLPKLHCYYALKEQPIMTRETRGNCQDCQMCLLAKSSLFDKFTCDPCSCNIVAQPVISTTRYVLSRKNILNISLEWSI